MATTARAAVFFGPGKPFEIKQVPIPEIEPDGVLIRVTHANICGSDLHFWRGDAPLRHGWTVAAARTAVTVQGAPPLVPGRRPDSDAINSGVAERQVGRKAIRLGVER